MIQVRGFQDTQGDWLRYNFPNAEPWEALAGLTEEVGELAHAHLKGHNKIRGLESSLDIAERKGDAVGDIFIYLTSYCNTNGLDLQACIEKAWAEVEKRDWIANPTDGSAK